MPGRYDLVKVCELVQEWLDGDSDKIWFTPRRKSYGAVGFLFKQDDTCAQETIARGLLKLDPVEFYRQQYLSGRCLVADVYGLENYRGHNWYVKFFLEQEGGDHFLSLVSFHPLDEVMKSEAGKMLLITYQGDRPWQSK